MPLELCPTTSFALVSGALSTISAKVLAYIKNYAFVEIEAYFNFVGLFNNHQLSMIQMLVQEMDYFM